ncbi:MAG: hypothetical protein ACOYN5_01380 [Bacteroidales bacterium]
MKKKSLNSIKSKKKDSVESVKKSTQSATDLSLLTPAETCLKVYGMKLSNAKVGMAFMASFPMSIKEIKKHD